MLTITARDGDLVENGTWGAGWSSLVYREALNGPAGWQLVAPFTHPIVAALADAGSGIVVRRDGVVAYSGPVSPAGTAAAQRRERTAISDLVTITGVSELTPLWWRAVQPADGQSHVEKSGSVGVAVGALVESQVGSEAGDRAIPGWQAAQNEAGDQISVAARYVNLGEYAADIVRSAGDLWMRARYQPSTSGGSVVFTVRAMTDTHRPISIEAGTASRIVSDTVGSPSSAVFALGQGEGADRAVSYATDPTLSGWARIETVIDRRDLATKIKSGFNDLDLAATAAVDLGGTSVTVEMNPGVELPRVGETVATFTSVGIVDPTPVVASQTTVTADSVRDTVTLGHPGVSTSLGRVASRYRVHDGFSGFRTYV